MLGIIAKFEYMMSDLVEAALPIESDCTGIVLPDAKPDLISVASQSRGEQLGHERLSNAFAVPPHIYVDALDFGRPRRQYARRRSPPTELGVTSEFDTVVANESLDLRTGDFGCLNGFAIGVRTMSIHVLARIQ